MDKKVTDLLANLAKVIVGTDPVVKGAVLYDEVYRLPADQKEKYDHFLSIRDRIITDQATGSRKRVIAVCLLGNLKNPNTGNLRGAHSTVNLPMPLQGAIKACFAAAGMKGAGFKVWNRNFETISGNPITDRGIQWEEAAPASGTPQYNFAALGLSEEDLAEATGSKPSAIEDYYDPEEA